MVNRGMNLLFRGEVLQAAQISSQLLNEAPDLAQSHYLATEVAMAQRQFAHALEHINHAIGLDRREPALWLKKAEIELILRQALQAQETVASAVALDPENPVLQMEAARIFSQSNNHHGAEKFYLQLRNGNQKAADFLFDFARNQFFLGKTQEAEQAASDFLDLGLPRNGQIMLLRARLSKQTRESNHVEMLKSYLAGKLSDMDAVYTYYALAKELEDLGEYSESFEALQSGARIQRGLVKFDLAEELRNIDDLINTFQPESFARTRESNRSDAPIFIVGMPRTGTTLVERIVSNSNEVKTAGETHDFPLAMSSIINSYLAAHPDEQLNPMTAALEVEYTLIAEHYMNSMQGSVGDAKRYLDKFPFNFLYCGLINKAFPKARIIHMVRDPMDTCYAVYQTLFHQLCYFSYDLDDIASYYTAYRRLMDHWHSLMPGVILDVSYETLVSNPAQESKRIAEYVGIPWTEHLTEVHDAVEACSTASAAQVRKPINTASIHKWRNYESQLEPLRKRLTAAGLIAGGG